MAELVTLENSRHFMSLTDGFPIPKHKSGILQQVLGIPFLFPSYQSINEDEDLSRPTQYESLSLHYSFNSKINAPVLESRIEKLKDIYIEPHSIGLIPASEWSPNQLTLEQIQSTYFSRRNGTSRQFDIKLYNALCITKNVESAIPHIGVVWIDATHFKVNEKIFSNFIGNKIEHVSLFDKQGPFSRYGFEQVYKGVNPKLCKNQLCDDVDDCTVRIFKDSMQRFARDKAFATVI